MGRMSLETIPAVMREWPLEKQPTEPVAGGEEGQDHQRHNQRDRTDHRKHRRAVVVQLPVLSSSWEVA